MKKLLSYWGIVLVCILSYWSVAPLFHPGFFPFHDDTQVARVFEMTKSLQDGMFPVRWVSDLGYGYGYPIFTFYGPFAYYLGGFMSLLGVSALLATKLMIFIGMLLAGVGMYLLARIFWGEYGGIIAGLMYVYAPYHAINLYVRGAVGELFGYACIPFVFYGIYLAFKKARFRYSLVAGVSYTALLISHNLTGLMLTPFILIFLLFLTFFALTKNKRMSFYFMYAPILLGLFLSAFYWLPALSEMHYTNVISQVGGAADFRDHYICLSQLWESPWGFAGSARGCTDGLSFRLGKMHILLSLVSLIFLPFLWRRERLRALAIGVAGFFLLLAVFFSLEYSRFIWKVFQVLSFIQYPWRFLMIMSAASSFLGGAAFWAISSSSPVVRKVRPIHAVAAFFIVLCVISFYAKLFVPQNFLNKTSEDYTNLNIIRTHTSAISDEYMPQHFKRPKTIQDIPTKRVDIFSSEARIISSKQKTQFFQAEIVASSNTPIHINLAYFPAWKVFIDKKESTFSILQNGLEVSMPKGNHTLELRYQSTLVEKMGNTLSLIGIFMLVAGIIFFSSKRVL